MIVFTGESAKRSGNPGAAVSKGLGIHGREIRSRGEPGRARKKTSCSLRRIRASRSLRSLRTKSCHRFGYVPVDQKTPE